MRVRMCDACVCVCVRMRAYACVCVVVSCHGAGAVGAASHSAGLPGLLGSGCHAWSAASRRMQLRGSPATRQSRAALAPTCARAAPPVPSTCSPRHSSTPSCPAPARTWWAHTWRAQAGGACQGCGRCVPRTRAVRRRHARRAQKGGGGGDRPTPSFAWCDSQQMPMCKTPRPAARRAPLHAPSRPGDTQVRGACREASSGAHLLERLRHRLALLTQLCHLRLRCTQVHPGCAPNRERARLRARGVGARSRELLVQPRALIRMRVLMTCALVGM